jgi:PKD repeat protein
MVDLITVVGPPEVDFSLDTTQGTCQLAVTFTDQTNFGDPAASDTATYTWDWTFHDGSPDSTASGAIVTHTFNHPGTPAEDVQFDVTLVVTSACGVSELTKDTVVTVAPCAR